MASTLAYGPGHTSAGPDRQTDAARSLEGREGRNSFVNWNRRASQSKDTVLLKIYKVHYNLFKSIGNIFFFLVPSSAN